MASASSSHGHGHGHSHDTLGLTTEDSSTFEDSADETAATVDQKPATFTRSLSPIILRRNADSNAANGVTQENGNHARTPSSFRSSHPNPHLQHRKLINLLPKYYTLNTSIPHFSAQIDIRKLLEHLILFSAVSIALTKFTFSRNVVHEPWITRGMCRILAEDAYSPVTRAGDSHCCFGPLHDSNTENSSTYRCTDTYRTRTPSACIFYRCKGHPTKAVPLMDDYPEGL
jgi:hypothetical protein